MFVLISIKDSIRVPPHQFADDREAVLKDKLNLKYSNRMIENEGLCLCVHEVEKIGDGVVYPGDGGSHTEVTARLIIFKSYEGEIFDGTIESADEQGIRVSLGFFSDILIPPHRLPSVSEFKRGGSYGPQGTWVWKYLDDEGNSTEEYAFHAQEVIRFKVHSIRFTTTVATDKGFTATTTEKRSEVVPATTTARAATKDTGMGMGMGAMGAGGKIRTRTRSMSIDLTSAHQAPPAMMLIGQCVDPGLGLVSWW